MEQEEHRCRLRALEPTDVELLYRWENDPEIWHVSGTLAPFSRHALEGFVEAQQYDIFQSRQQRLIITSPTGEAIGTLDLFEIDPLHRRAGVGILIHGEENRHHGYAGEALAVALRYARNTLGLEQLWCNIESDNAASLALFRAAGFERVGIKHHWNWSPDGWKDEELWQCLLTENSLANH